eukprot:s1320_g13.t1
MADVVAMPAETEPTEVVEIASTQLEPAGSADAEKAEAVAWENAEQAKGEETEEVKCRRCMLPVQKADAICTPKFREDLRWTCKGCHAVKSQLARRGIELNSCLTEDDVVAFYLDDRPYLHLDASVASHSATCYVR